MTDTSTGSANGFRFELRLPQEWQEIVLDPASRGERIASFFSDEVRAEYAEDVAILEATLRKSAAEAFDAGIDFVAGVFDIDADEDPPVPLAAVMSIGIVSTVTQGLNSQTIAESILRRARESSVMTSVDLPAGTAVRRCETKPMQPEGFDEQVDFFCGQYFIPIPADDSLVVMTFLTPNVDLEAPFMELFDAIAATFELHPLNPRSYR